MGKFRIKTRMVIYFVIVLVTSAAVSLRQGMVRRERGKEIVSLIAQRDEFGIPVTIRKARKEKVREYARFSVLPETAHTATGFVTGDLQERLSQGQEVYLCDQSLEPVGVIDGISRNMDVDTGMFYVQIKTGKTVPLDKGLYVIYVHTETYLDTISVPNDILDIEDDKFYLWKVVGGKASRVRVEVSSRNGYGAIISKGIEEGDIVICSGQSQLREGDRVRVVAVEEDKAGTCGGIL